MKILMSTILASFLFVAIMLSIDHTPKAWGDVASLNQQTPKKGDFIQLFTSLGQPYTVNWVDFDRALVSSVNWYFVAPPFNAAAAVNWTTTGGSQYIGQ